MSTENLKSRKYGKAKKKKSENQILDQEILKNELREEICGYDYIDIISKLNTNYDMAQQLYTTNTSEFINI